MQVRKIIANHTFSSDEIRELGECRDSQKNPDIRCRFVALLPISGKMSLCKVASVIGKSVKTLRRRFKKYYLRGADAPDSYLITSRKNLA